MTGSTSSQKNLDDISKSGPVCAVDTNDPPDIKCVSLFYRVEKRNSTPLTNF